MFNQFIFATQKKKRLIGAAGFSLKNRNLNYSLEFYCNSKPLVHKFHSLFKIEIRMNEVASNLQAAKLQVLERTLVGR